MTDLRTIISKVDHPLVIAIDGYSSSGKSTMARSLARSLGYRYIDSGAMYRAVALYAIQNNMADNPAALIARLDDIHVDFRVNPDGSQSTLLNGTDVESQIRSMAVSSLVSQIATLPEVRRRMVERQQQFGQTGGIVMDGRDIGTTVFPHADIKIFVNASAEKRAARRFAELQAKNPADCPAYREVLDNIRQRDYTDTHRADSPLCPAPDALFLDNSDMTPAQQDMWLAHVIEQHLNPSRH